MSLKVDQVTKKYGGLLAVDNLTYSFDQGIYGIIGPNGAGKTTLLRMICGLMEPTSGSILFEGNDIKDIEGEYQKSIGYLPQKVPYYADFLVYDFLMYMAIINEIKNEKRKKIVNEILHEVGLSEKKNVKICSLSGGMKQRLGIAQALISNPDILVLDEPTAGLDPSERVRFRKLIHKLSRKKSVLISTHIISDIEYIADKILIMKSGNIILDGSIDDILESVKNKVWVGDVPTNKYETYTNYNIVSVTERKDKTRLRIVSDVCPDELFSEISPELEDVYLYVFREEGKYE